MKRRLLLLGRAVAHNEWIAPAGLDGLHPVFSDDVLIGWVGDAGAKGGGSCSCGGELTTTHGAPKSWPYPELGPAYLLVTCIACGRSRTV